MTRVAANLTAIIISMMANWKLATSYTPSSSQLSGLCRLRSRQPIISFSTASSSPLRSTTSTVENNNNDLIEQSNAPFWHSRQDCWRPDVRDVENISWGLPAKKKGTGSRGIPHRLNQEERLVFDQARRQGFLQVTGSAWRSQRRDAPLLNSYRSLMDARGRPMIVLHKMSPVHVRIGCFGRWHQVFGNGQHKIHVQVFGVPLDGFFGVFAAVSGVVNSAYFHDFPLGVYLKGATSNLITF